MKNIKNHFGIKQTLTLALVVSMLVQTLVGVVPAFAHHGGGGGESIFTATISGSPVTVAPGASVGVNLSISNLGNGEKWLSIRAFTPNQKREAFERRKVCILRAKETSK